MSQSFVVPGATLIRPGAYSNVTVQTGSGGAATNGVVVLVGEADAGPDFTIETAAGGTGLQAFDPSARAAVVAKYKSGNLVDAFQACANPSADAQIPGSPNLIYLVKSNPSTKASAAVKNWAGTTWGTLADKSWGKLGNLINYSVDAKVSEVVPTTGLFTYVPVVGTVNLSLVVNGGTAQPLSLTAAQTPVSFASAAAGLTGLSVSGGALRSVLPSATGTVTITVPSGNNVLISYTSAFTTTPSVGDTLTIGAAGAIGTASSTLVGSYVVTAATNATIAATKLNDAGRGGAPLTGAVTTPAPTGPVTILSTTDLNVFAPVQISLAAANPIAGAGKSLEIANLGTGTDNLGNIAYALSATASTFISKTGAPTVLVSASEYQAHMAVNRQTDNISEDITAGGDIVLTLGYKGTTASVVVTATSITANVTGGVGAGWTAALKDFATIASLAAFISSQTGWTAVAGTAVQGFLPSLSLDQGTYTVASVWGANTGRIKSDAYKFFNALSNSVLVQLGAGVTPAQAAADLPAPTTGIAFLSGGAKGGTTQATVQAAIDALLKLRVNAVVPLFSRDATADITDALTDSTSTYTIDSINAYVKSHVIAASKVKSRRNRQGYLSKRDTFANVKLAAAGITNARCSMSFQDQKVVGANGLAQFQPWMDAAIAAGTQMAGGYKAIFGKVKNVSGSVQAAGDFDDQDDAAVEDALKSGLLVTVRHADGSYQYESDQTTYGQDANQVFNSIQQMYIADQVATTLGQRMEDAFKSKSLGDFTAQTAKTYLESIMNDFLLAKWIAPSSDALKGFKNAKITISGIAMTVEVEVKLANALYFIYLPVLVSKVTQSA